MDDELLDDLVEIFVETLTGSCIAIECYNSDTIQFLKQRVWEYEGIPVDQQCLIYRDVELADEETVAVCRLVSGCSVKLVPRAKAGPANLPSIFSSLPKDASKISSAEIEYLLKQGDLTVFPADHSNPSSRYVAVRDGDSYRILQVVETSRPSTSKANSASLSEAENVDIDLTFTDERRSSALQRAKDNLRTMQKMQELRRTMERLNFERGRRRQQVLPSEDAAAAAISPRQRRSSGKSKDCAPSTSSKKFNRGLSAPEDTSAKESSAGETEYEDLQQRQPLPNCPNCRAVRVGAEKTRYFGVPKPSKMVVQHQMKSSSSERDLDSSVQDLDQDLELSDNDLLFTADEQFGNEEDFEGDPGDSEGLEENEDSMGDGFYGDEVDEDPDDYLSAESREICQKNKENPDGEPEAAAHSDLSEFSSGMIMCELPEARRPKIRRKHPKLPGSRIQPRPPSIAETDEQSATEEFGYQKFSLKPPGMYVQMIRRPRDLDVQMIRRPRDLDVQMIRKPRDLDVQMIRKPRDLVRQSSDPQAIPKGGPAPVNMPAGTCPFHASAKWKQHPAKPGKSKKSTGESSSDEPENKSSSIQLSSSLGFDPHNNVAWRHGKATASTSSNVRKVSAATVESNRRAQFRQARRCSTEKAPKFLNPPTMWTQYGAASCSPQPAVGPMPVAGPSGGANGPTIGSAAKHSHKAPQSSQSQQRCNTCGYKLSIATTFQCRCGKTVCSRHRNAEMHNCSYDFKGEGRRQLAKEFGGVSGCAPPQRLPKL